MIYSVLIYIQYSYIPTSPIRFSHTDINIMIFSLYFTN
jgi:hypothetical protein